MTDTTLPPGDEGLRAEQSLAEHQRQATLVVVVEWTRERDRSTETYTRKAEAQVQQPTEICQAPDPTPTPTVSPEPSPEPSPTPTETPTAPETPTPTPTPTEPGEPTSPEGFIEFTCDEMIFTIVNPEDGETVTVTFTPNTGEPETLTVEPGYEGSISVKWLRRLKLTEGPTFTKDETSKYTELMPDGRARQRLLSPPGPRGQSLAGGTVLPAAFCCAGARDAKRP